MNLTIEDFKLGRDLVEECLKLEDDKIVDHIQESIKCFSNTLDISKLDDRNKLFEFLHHLSTLFLNFDINAGLYLLGEKEVKKAVIGRGTISGIIKGFREAGF